MAQFSTVFPETRYKLFRSYCMAIYGSQLWDLSCRELDTFFTAWRKAIRFVWRIPNTTHRNLLHLICNDLPVEFQIHKRFIKFFHNVLNSSNQLVRTCGLLASNGSRTSACNSFNVMVSKYKLNRVTFNTHSLVKCIKQMHIKADVNSNDEDIIIAALVRELCRARDGQLTTILTRTETVDAINTFCTT